ncbi:flavin reductase [Planosporangium mesophilum]|uniref:Flavin reductase n=1 Tax=Planosporangium mesophilum TaxID=689768 RepID=A0A8J3X1B9_9ACTN|nr:flavin reductase [Planosporangium mesophilum]NJC81549.1 flavin reductase [Planosporangium mesophilum]GII20793.1 hypothetical protein Pme01_03900 [Planosporangium mesophilum]
MTGLHVPMRPAWTCAGCGADWPCRTKRVQLLAEYERARVSLGLLMSAYFVDAAEDLSSHASGLLYTRFLGWTRASAAAGQGQRHG